MIWFDIFMGVPGFLYLNALLLWIGLGQLVLSDDEDVVPRIIGLFWLALLAYFDVMFLPDVLRAIRQALLAAESEALFHQPDKTSTEGKLKSEPHRNAGAQICFRQRSR